MAPAHVETVRQLHDTAVRLSCLLRLRRRLVMLDCYGAQLLLVEIKHQLADVLEQSRSRN